MYLLKIISHQLIQYLDSDAPTREYVSLCLSDIGHTLIHVPVTNSTYLTLPYTVPIQKTFGNIRTLPSPSISVRTRM